MIYRTRAGEVVALEDRCPHRNVPLSGGCVLDDDSLQCPYHGWRFRSDGSCSLIPGSLLATKPSQRVPSFSICEAQGIVFVCLQGTPAHEPLAVPEAEDGEHSVVLRHVEFPAGLHQVVENALDVPHTSILHGGLFRSGERNRVGVTFRRYRDWAEAEYAGEPPPTGLAARVLWLGSQRDVRVEHWDRFFLPGILQVEYRLGDSVHFLITGYCCPVSENKTSVFAIACVKTPFAGFLERFLVRVLQPLAMKVLRQDMAVLQAQSENVEHFGEEQFMSTEIDVFGAAITRLLKDCRAREALDEDRRPEDSNTDAPSFSRDQEPVQVTRLELDA